MIKLIVLTFDETMRCVWENLSQKFPTLVTKREVPFYIPEKDKKLVEMKQERKNRKKIKVKKMHDWVTSGCSSDSYDLDKVLHDLRLENSNKVRAVKKSKKVTKISLNKEKSESTDRVEKTNIDCEARKECNNQEENVTIIKTKPNIQEFFPQDMIQELINSILCEVMYVVDDDFTVPLIKAQALSPFLTEKGVIWRRVVSPGRTFFLNPGYTQERAVGFVGFGNVPLPDYSGVDDYGEFKLKQDMVFSVKL